MYTGVLIFGRDETEDRAAASAAMLAMFVEWSASFSAAAISGERASIDFAKPSTIPDFAICWGQSALKRSVHVSVTSAALYGIPAARPFQAWPPPYEMPQAPTCVSLTSGSPSNHATIARSVATSSAPARS